MSSSLYAQWTRFVARQHRVTYAVHSPAGVKTLAVGIEDAPAASNALAGTSFDAVVDWIGFEPAHVERDNRAIPSPITGSNCLLIE